MILNLRVLSQLLQIHPILVIWNLSSPIYSDLTSSVSSDSIFNLAISSFVSRFLFFDFETARATPTSFNSAIFGAIILSSQLENSRRVLINKYQEISK